jgi:hypothetical protein
MYEALGPVALKTGEQVEAGVVTGPDPEWAPRLERLLAHKGEPWNWQNSRMLRADVGIDARFYVLHRDGALFANILVATRAGVGFLAHVWTAPEDRQKGASTGLMALQMDDTQARGGRALFLSTGFGSVAYRIYERFGFESIEPESGYMAWYAEGRETFENAYFSAGKVEIQPLAGPHWLASGALFMGDYPGLVRCAPLGLTGRRSTEGPLLGPLQDEERRRGVGEPPRALVLQQTETTAVAGLTLWDWHPLWPDTCVVDVYCHPDYWEQAGPLLQALVLPAADRYVAYADAGDGFKAGVLREAGFREMVVLKDRVARDAARTGWVDVAVYER